MVGCLPAKQPVLRPRCPSSSAFAHSTGSVVNSHVILAMTAVVLALAASAARGCAAFLPSALSVACGLTHHQPLHSLGLRTWWTLQRWVIVVSSVVLVSAVPEADGARACCARGRQCQAQRRRLQSVASVLTTQLLTLPETVIYLSVYL